MSNHLSSKNSLGMAVRKFFLSAFVVITFLAYVLHERFTAAMQANAPGGSGGTATPSNGVETAPKSRTTSVIASNDADEDDAGTSIRHSADHAPAPAQADGASVSAGSAATDTATPLPTVIPTATSQPSDARYKDGTYTGSEADAYYGLVQVQAVIQNGRITGVSFLEYPNHRRTSVQINEQVIPWLQQEAIQAQSAQVDLISGATLTSQAFVESLQVALDSARN